jgi:hypothetical protein
MLLTPTTLTVYNVSASGGRSHNRKGFNMPLKRKQLESKPLANELTIKGVRLDLSPEDHARLQRCAKARGLNMASYARQAVLTAIRDDERKDG